MRTIREYIDANGNNPFKKWFGELDKTAAEKVEGAIDKLELGLRSNVAPVGAGVFEIKIDFGPGYRVYFGQSGRELILLLGGGIKKRQSKDIDSAKRCWVTYKERKKNKTA